MRAPLLALVLGLAVSGSAVAEGAPGVAAVAELAFTTEQGPEALIAAVRSLDPDLAAHLVLQPHSPSDAVWPPIQPDAKWTLATSADSPSPLSLTCRGFDAPFQPPQENVYFGSGNGLGPEPPVTSAELTKAAPPPAGATRALACGFVLIGPQNGPTPLEDRWITSVFAKTEDVLFTRRDNPQIASLSGLIASDGPTLGGVTLARLDVIFARDDAGELLSTTYRFTAYQLGRTPK